MTLSPLDIQNKSFEKKMRGYAPDDVDDFLDQVVRDYEDLNQKNYDLEKILKHANEKLEYFNELKDALNQSIIVAQDTADKVKHNASNEADVILKSAKQGAEKQTAAAQESARQIVDGAKMKAREILNRAVHDAKVLSEDTDELKSSARFFHQRLTLMLESELKTVKSKEWDDLLTPLSATLPSDNELLKEILEKSERKVVAKSGEQYLRPVSRTVKGTEKKIFVEKISQEVFGREETLDTEAKVAVVFNQPVITPAQGVGSKHGGVKIPGEEEKEEVR